MSRKDKFAMNLVRYYPYIIPKADFPKRVSSCFVQTLPAGLCGLHNSRTFYTRVSRLPFQIDEVHLISSVRVNQWIGGNLASVIADGGEKAVIDRCLHDYFISGSCQRLDDS